MGDFFCWVGCFFLRWRRGEGVRNSYKVHEDLQGVRAVRSCPSCSPTAEVMIV